MTRQPGSRVASAMRWLDQNPMANYLCGTTLDAAKRHEIAESVISGRNTGAEMARLYNVSAPTVSRIVSAHRTGLADINRAVR